jgi:hypothetical protein
MKLNGEQPTRVGSPCLDAFLSPVFIMNMTEQQLQSAANLIGSTDAVSRCLGYRRLDDMREKAKRLMSAGEASGVDLMKTVVQYEIKLGWKTRDYYDYGVLLRVRN